MVELKSSYEECTSSAHGLTIVSVFPDLLIIFTSPLENKIRMDKNTLRLLLSFAVIGSFFFPLFDWNSFEMNGLNYILSEHIPRYKYLLAFIPLTALVIFIGAWYEDNFLFRRRIILWIPLLSLSLVFLMRLLRPDYPDGYADYQSPLITTDIGFWLTMLFSALLPMIDNKKESGHHKQSHLVDA